MAGSKCAPAEHESIIQYNGDQITVFVVTLSDNVNQDMYTTLTQHYEIQYSQTRFFEGKSQNDYV